MQSSDARFWLVENEGGAPDSGDRCELRNGRLSGSVRIPALQRSSYHAARGTGRLRFDSSLPRPGYVPLRRKGSR